MVHVYNCHPFSSQQIVQVEQEPGLVCCGGGALFVVAAGGCKVEVYNLEVEDCPLICRFGTMGAVRSISYSSVGDYLVTIEEKNSATYLRAYTNWRLQAEEKARVGVRLLGHLLRGASVRGGVQMEIIEIPMAERPVAVACCALTGHLLVACENTLVLFHLKKPLNPGPNQQSAQNVPRQQPTLRQDQGPESSALDFERSMILHLSTFRPRKVALCAGYIALHSELEVLVLKLEASSESAAAEEPSTQVPSDDVDAEEQTDFLVLPRHLELLGDRAKDCEVVVKVEKTGMEDGGQSSVSYVLFRRFTPEFFQGCNVDETQIHSLHLHPLLVRGGAPDCVFCFFSLPSVGFLYSVSRGVELLSQYQYPEKILSAALTSHLLHVVTRNALQSFTVRCAAFAARVEDPYIDTTVKACPPCSLEVCALRMQLFIGLRSVCVHGRHVVLLSRSDPEPQVEPERTPPRRGLTKKMAAASPKEPSAAGHGWNLYVIDTVSPLGLYQEMVEYSRSYSEANPQAQSLRHVLSEAHLLLRASLLTAGPSGPRDDGGPRDDRDELEAALRENCAQLGDCFSRGSQKDCHLTLPYYRMSGLSVPEVMVRNQPQPGSPQSYGPGFLFYLKHYLLEEPQLALDQAAADEVINIFSQSEPSQLVAVCCSPVMANIRPAQTLDILRRLEDGAGVSVTLTVTMATLALRLDDTVQYRQLMDRHSEMLLVYGFIEEPRLLVQGSGGGQQVRTTALASEMVRSQPGILVAALVALHENSKVNLEQADHVFKELGCENCLQVDFWEALLMASSQEPLIQELLFRVASVYIERLTLTDPDPRLGHSGPGRRSLKSADDLTGSCSHYGALYPWLSVLCPSHITNSQHQEALHKLQSLLCGPSLSVAAVEPLLERISEKTLWGFSLHLLCATRRGRYSSSIEKLLDRCPQAIIAFANHHLQEAHMTLWWQKLLPELCRRTRDDSDSSILLAALQETLVVVSMETSPSEFLELIPDDGAAAFFLPHLLTCSHRHA